MSKELELLKRKLNREELARKEAEQLLEQKSLELYKSNEKLKHLNANLEGLVEQRTTKLRESEMEYQTMVESISDMIFRLDMQGRITFHNQIAKRIIGVEHEEIMGRHILDFVQANERKRIFQHFARLFLQNHCVNYFQIEIQSRLKGRIWLRLNVQFSSPKCLLCVKKQHSMIENESSELAKLDCEFNEIIVVAHDITQQKLGQEKLEKSEKKYRELTESLPELICEVNKDGILTYANQYAIEKLGYTSEEVLGTNFSIWNIFAEEQREHAKKQLALIIKYVRSTSAEYLTQKKNGDVFPVIVYTTPVIENNEVIGVRGVMFDITTRRQQEQEIANNLKQQELLSRISLSYNTLTDFEEKTNEAIKLIGEHLQVSRTYIFEDDLEGLHTSNTYEWCNEGVEEQKDELQGIPYSLIPSWKKMLSEEGLVFSESIHQLPEDVVAILEPQGIKSILVFPLTGQGRQIGFIGFDECNVKRTWRQSEIELLRTISNLISHSYMRQRVQNELVESELENRVIINSIPDVIVHANNLGEIVALKGAQNSNFTHLIRNENSESIKETFNPKLAGLFLSAIEICLREQEYQVEFKNLNIEKVEYFEARLVKLNETEVLMLIRDVSSIKENQIQLEIAKNKAEDASRMKSEFLANVSHEIRTPLNAILGFSQWLFDNSEKEIHKGYLSSVLSSGQSLLDVINDILDLSRIDSGKMDIELTPMNYHEIISDVKLAYQAELQKKELNFKITVDDSVPQYVMMDELRFYQILLNLVSNAVKFTKKGYIHISAKAYPSELEDEIDLVIAVEDSGIGIREDKLQVIFQSFAQQDGHSARQFEGSGLGLAIVDGLLKKLNGTIHVKSKLKKGSTFTVTFSNVKVDKTEREIKSRDGENVLTNAVLGPCTIMIVDDIEFNIEVLKTLINSNEVSYIEANSGSDALAILNTQRPDLIFMDIRMPGIDGFEVTRMLKNDENLKSIPVIAFSASTLMSRKELTELLFDDFLQKPVFKQELENMLMRFLHDKYTFEVEEVEDIEASFEEAQEDSGLSNECVEKVEEVLAELEGSYIGAWEKIKDSLVIYEIEIFKNQLNELAEKNGCVPIIEYCEMLEEGLQVFDIELIEKQLSDFPNVIDELKKIKG